MRAEVRPRKERRAAGRELRKSVGRSEHAGWIPPPDRRDPVELIEEQNVGRLEWLVPVRRGRMTVSAFTFYRGAARLMAHDLATTPVSGLRVQLCGDAHLANFGAYASPERTLVFDLNDFDETLAGPFEWDVKRLAASFTMAALSNGHSDREATAATRAVVSDYREAMREFADTPPLEVYYRHLDLDEVSAAIDADLSKSERKSAAKARRKARKRTNLRAASRLAEVTDDGMRIRSDPPLLVSFRELSEDRHPEELQADFDESYTRYRRSVASAIRELLARYRIDDMAVKVVGVGSVGTRCLVAVLDGGDPDAVMVIQQKEAGRSVLAEHLPAGPYRNQGRRVVEGQRLMQATSDPFLGWTRGHTGHDFYWRQLKDWKGSVDLDDLSPRRLRRYARVCGWTLARAHAVSGDPAAIAGYLGSGTSFDEAVAEFAREYVDQNQADYERYCEVIDQQGLPLVPDDRG